MSKYMVRSMALACSLITASSLLFSSVAADNAPDFRKRDMNITIKNGDNAIADVDVKIEQTRHHFGFGAAMAYWPMDSAHLVEQYKKTIDSASVYKKYGSIVKKYGPAFAKYFQWLTPENEMKWGDNQYIRDADNYYKGDALVEFAKENNMKVRGHNVFWHEHMDWVPDWIKDIACSTFSNVPGYQDTGLAIINERIDGVLEKYKGECAHWDIINEITHGKEDLVCGDTKNVSPVAGTLKLLSGKDDYDIFEHILKRSREVEPDAKFCLNDYNLVTQHNDTRDKYIEIVNKLTKNGCDVDIIGCEGHFSSYFKKDELKTKIDYFAKNIENKNAEIWLTEVDFTAPSSDEAADWIDGILDVCFNHERVGGVCLWTPWEGNRWRENLNSFVLDTNFNETPMGAKWLEKIKGWTTNETEKTDDDGKVAVKGVHGEYKISFTIDGVEFDTTVYLDPGTDPLKVDFAIGTSARKKTVSSSFANRTILVNNNKIAFNVPVTEKGQFFVSAYSISGKLLAKTPLSFNNGVSKINKMPKGCHIYRIGTETTNYHTVRGLNIN